MKIGTMFASLKYYLYDKNYIQTHPYFVIYTEKGVFKLEVTGSFSAHTESQPIIRFDFSSDIEKEEYTKYINSLNQMTWCDKKLDVDDKIVLLTTCTKSAGNDDERLFVVGKLIEIEI